MTRTAVMVVILMLGFQVWAATPLNLQGRILRPDSTPVTGNNVQFKIQIRSPGSEDCLLYEEVQTLDMTASSGVFSLGVGAGTRSAATIDGGYSFDRIFANRGSLDFSATAPSACQLGSVYNPSLADARRLVYSFNEGTGWQAIPSTAINWSPFSIEALQVGGFRASNLLRVLDAAGNPQAAPTLLPTDVTELLALISGTSTRYVQPSSTATFSSTITFSNAPQFSGAPSGANDLTNKTYVDAAISTGVAAGLPNVGTAGTYFKVSTDSKGRVTSGASSLVAADIPSLDASKVTTGTFGGAVGMNTSGNIYSSGTVTGGTVSATNLRIYNGTNYLQVSAGSMSGNLNWILPNGNGSAGQVLRTDGAGNLSWVAASTGSVTGITATPPLAAGTGATPNITITQATTSTDGYLSSTDFNTFNNKLGASSTFAGDVSGVSTSTVVDKLKGVALSISALTSGNFLKYNGANWINANLSNADITTGLGFAPVNKAGDSMSGLLVLSADPSATLGASTKQYVDASTTTAAANYIRKDGTVAFTGPQSMGSNKLTSVADPTLAQDAATKNYADTKILGKVATAPAAGQDGQSLRWNNASLAWEYFATSAGSVTNVATGTGLTGGPITSNGTISLSSTTVAAGSYGTTVTIPTFNVDAQGRLTGVTAQAIPSANTSTTGLLTNTDWNTFNSKLGSSSTFAGDVSGVYSATSVDKLKGAALAITSLTSGNFLKYNGTNWVNTNLVNADITTGLGYAPVNKVGDSMTGLLVLSADPSAALGAATKNYADTKIVGKTAAAPAAGQNGQSLRWNNGSLAWEYYTPVTGTGLTNLNGATGTTQTFANGATGTAPAFMTASDIHTLNIPMANTASVTAGLISKTEFDTFNTKLGTSSTFAGDVSGLYNALSVDKLKNAPLSITSLTSGNFLKYNGSNWVNTNLVNADITTGLGYAPVNKAGDSMTGLLVLSADPSANLGSATKQYVDSSTTTAGANYIRKDGTVAFTGTQSMGSNKLTFVLDPVAAQDAATKNYADTKLFGKAGTAPAAGQDGQSLRWNNASLAWEYFSNSSGSVTNVATGTGLTGGPITSNGTISLASTTVAAGSYGTTVTIPTFNVDAQGRLTGVTAQAIPSATTSVTGLLTSTDWNTFNSKLGSASTFAGDVSGLYNALSVDKLKNAPLSITSLTSGNFLKYNGTNWVNTNLANADITTALGYAPVNKAGDSMTGLLVLSGDPSANLGSATKQYVDSSTTTAGANYIRKDGTVAFTGTQSMGSNKLTFVLDPVAAQDAATKNYADTKILGKVATAPAAGQDGQSLRWNNASLAWEYFATSAGSVTNVATGTGLTGGPITSNGTISLSSTTVAAGSYGTTVTIPTFNVDAQGRLTGVTAQAIPSANTSTTGLLTNTDWNTFSSKLGSTSTFAGDVSGLYNALSVDKLKNAPLSITSLTSGNFLKYNGSNWVNTNLANADITTGLGYAPVNKVGDSMTGLLLLSGDPAAATGAATKNYADTKILSKTAAAPAAGQNGQSLRWNNGSLAWEYYTPITGSGLTNLNGAVGNSQTFANGASGTTPAFVTASDVHTLNIPMANTASVTAGLISKTEFDTFNTKLGTSSTFAGDVSGLYNALSVDKLKNAPLSITSLTSGNFLKYNGTNWVNTNLANADITTGLGYAPVNKAGDSMTGLLVLSADPSANLGSATKQYVDSSTTTAAANYIRKDGTVAFTGTQSMGSNKLTFVTDPTTAQDAATKNYADAKLFGKTGTAPAAGQDGQSLRWNNASLAWEYFATSAGSVTNVATGTGLTGGPITSNGTISLASTTVAAGSYGTTVTIPTFNVDAQGRLTGVTAQAIPSATNSVTGLLTSTDWNTFNSKLGTSSTFAGDVSGLYNALSVDKLKNAPLSITSLTSGNFLKYNGTSWVNTNLANADITTGLGYTPVNRAGDSMTGLLLLSADPAAATGAATKNYADTKILGKTATAPAAGQDGQSLRWNNASLAWEYFATSAGSVTNVATGTGLTGGPITSNGTISLASTTVAAGSYGTTVTIPTFNVDAQGRLTGVTAQAIPSANTSTTGLLTNTDWNTFSSKLGSTSTFAGDISGLYNALSVDKLKNAPLSITSLTSGNFLKYNGSNWVNTNLVNADITTGLGYAPVNKAGDSMTGLLVLSGDPSANLGSATKQYVDASTTTAAANYIRKDGTVAFTGTQSMGSNKLTFVLDPVAAQDAATKNYADTKLFGKAGTAPAAGQDGQSLRWNNASLAWEYFANSSGSVTNVATGTGLTGGPITSNGTISLASTTVAAGSYGTTVTIPTFNVDAQGRLTGVTAQAIPNATTSVTGLLTNTDWNTFNTKLGSTSTFAGDVSGLYNAMSVDKLKGAPLSIASLVSGNFLRYNGTNWVNTNLVNADITTGLGYAPVSKTGDTMSGLLVLSADPSAALGAATKQYADSKILSKTATAPAAGQDGQSLRWNNGTVAWEYYTPVAASGITNLNGATGTSQSFASGATGTAPAFVTATNVHTLNIPMANTASVTAGLISKTEFDTFNTKLGTSSTFAGDVSGLYNSLSVDKLKNAPLSITSLTSGNFLKYNGTNWVNTNLVNADITTGLGYAPVNKAGDSMTGLLVLSADPSANLGSATKQYVDSSTTTAAANYVRKDGTVAFTGTQSMGSNKLTFVLDPVSAQDAATKNYADTKLFGKAGTAPAAGQDGQSLRWNNASLAWEYFATSTGSVTNVATGTGLTGGPITSNGTISLSSTTVTAGSYGTSVSIPTFNVDAQGRLTGVTAQAIPSANTSTTGLLTNTDWNTFNSKLGTSSTFVGDVSGVYNATSVDKLKGAPLSITSLTSGNFLRYNGTNWVNTNLVNADITTGLGFAPVNKAGDSMTGLLVLSADPSAALGAATKQYADTKILSKTATAPAAGQDGQALRWNNTTTAWEYFTPTAALGYTAVNKAGDTMTGALVLPAGTVAAPSDAIGTATNGFWAPAANAVALSTNSLERLRVDASGNVGIGTTAPTKLLTVSGGDALINGLTVGLGAGGVASNTAIGKNTLLANTTGSANTAVGENSLGGNTVGVNNTALGDYSLYYNSGKYESTAVGYLSMFYADNATGAAISYNTAIGAYSLRGSTSPASNTGIKNTALGHSALQYVTSGSNNIGLGYNAGNLLTTGSNNVIIGSNTGSTFATLSNNISINDGAGNERIRVDATGLVGLGTTLPGYKLDVVGDVNVTGNFKINGTNIGGGAGTVTNIATGTGLTGGPITSTGTISLASTTVAAGSYGTTVTIPTFNVDAQGRLTGVTAQAIPNATTSVTGLLTSTDWNTFNSKLGSASTFAGDVSGLYNALSVDKLKNAPLSITSLTSGNFLKYNGTNWVNTNLVNADITTGLGFAPVNKAGDSMTGLLVLSADPSAALGAATKQYADTKILSKTATAPAAGQDGQSLRWNNGTTAWEYYTPAAALGYTAVNKAGDTMTGALVLPAGTVAAPSDAIGTATNGFWAPAANAVALSTNSLERLRVDATGNVGIGVSNPAAKLDVNGGINTNGESHLTTGSYFDPGAGIESPVKMAANTGSFAISSFIAGVSGAVVANANSYGGYFNNASTVSGTGVNYGIFAIGTNNYFSGKVGVGTSAPSEVLEVVGNVKAVSFISTSDRRLKKNITPVAGLSSIMKLNGYEYQWISNDDHDGGVIAQEVEKVFPYAVRTDARTGFKGVKYQYLMAPLIESTKELYGMCKANDEQIVKAQRMIANVADKTEALSKEVKSLQQQNKDLKNENQSLKRRMELIEAKLGIH